MIGEAKQAGPGWFRAMATGLAVAMAESLLALSVASPAAGTGTHATTAKTASALANRSTARLASLPATPVMMIGDSISLSLSYGLDLPAAQTQYGTNIQNVAILGCGFDTSDELIGSNGQPGPVNPACPPDLTTWKSDEASIHPDVILVEMGYWDCSDWLHAGTTMNITNPTFQTYEKGLIQNLINTLAPNGLPIVFLSIPAMSPPVPPTEPVRDIWSRHVEMNTLLGDVVAKNPGHAYMIDINPAVSPGGNFLPTVRGAYTRESDGEHFTFAGGELTQSLVLPEVHRLAEAYAAAKQTSNVAPPSRPAPSEKWSSPLTAAPKRGLITGDSCASATFCVAVDADGAALTYNGSWSAPVPLPLGGSGTALVSVGCPAAGACVAVDGLGRSSVLAGGKWSAAISFDASGYPDAISCASTTFCVAVDATGSAFVFNGTAWSGATALNSTGTGLAAVSCPTTSFCVAVGGREEWTYDKGAWAAPTSIDAAGDGLTSVSCASASYCMAVDGSGYGGNDFTVVWTSNVMIYNGSSWTAPVAIDSKGTGLTSVSCPIAGFCAVLDGAGKALVYENAAWSTPTTVNSYTGRFASVSCVSASFCAAVSYTDESTFKAAAWSAAADVDPGEGDLMAVSCPTTTFCAAITDLNYASTYNGKSWSRLSLADAPGDRLQSVSCVSSTFCVAVDAEGNSTSYDGKAWKAPVKADASADLTAVSCASITSCVAVDSGGRFITYNGTAWDAAKSIDATGAGLTAISCPTTSFCLTVDAAGRALRDSNGTWSPAVAITGGAPLTAVGCTAAVFCAAVDNAGDAFTYTGSSWSTASVLDPAEYGLSAVSCSSSSFCTAVGREGAFFNFNGSNWSSPSEIGAGTFAGYRGVDCLSTTFCVVAGGNDVVMGS
jgi:hypothetical protein